MQNLNTKNVMRTIEMPIDPTYKIVNVRVNPAFKELIIITGITDNEHNRLLHSADLNIKRGNSEFHITADNVFCYGDIDFSKGSDDCNEIDTFNWLDNLIAKGICIPSNYNYDKHECTTDRKYIMYTETFRNSTLCRYLHGCLGKPKYTLIFKEVK